MIEEQFNQSSADLQSEIEKNNKINAKIEALEQKISKDKKLFKETKQHYKALKQQFLETQTRLSSEIETKDQKINEINQKLLENQQQIKILGEESTII